MGLYSIWGTWEMRDWTKKVGDLGDWATNKVGDGRFGSKIGAGTGRLGKYALVACKIGRNKSGRLGDSDLHRGPHRC